MTDWISSKLREKPKHLFLKVYVKKLKREVTNWEKTFANHVSIGGLTARIYKELPKSDSEKKSIQLENGEVEQFTKEDI